MAIRFDASTDQLTGSGWSGNVHTISCWVRLVSDLNAFSNPWLVYPNTGGGGAVRAGLGTDSGGTQMLVFDSAFATHTGPNMSVGTWYYFCVVMNNTTWTLFYGTDPASLTTVGPFTRVAYTSPGSIIISLAAEWANMDLAALKIFTRALNATDAANEGGSYVVINNTSLVASNRWNTSASLTADEGAGVALTAGSTGVSFVAGPTILDKTLTPSGIATGAAVGSATLTSGASLMPDGIATSQAFGTAAVSQHITATGIATAAGLGSPVVTHGLTVAPFGIASGRAVGTPRVVNFPVLRQSGYEFIPGEQLGFNTQFEASTAVAGNLIVHCFAGDVDTGVITLDGTGWSKPVDLHYSDMTLYVSWKTAQGGELSVSGSIQQGNFSGSQSFVLEYTSVLPGGWVVKGAATNPSDGSNVTVWPSGTTGSLAGDGVAVAAFAVGAVLSNSADTFSNSYTSRFSQGAGVFEAGLWVADKNVLSGTATSSTITRAAPVTADQTHGSVTVFGKAVVSDIAPTGIASGVLFGTPSFPGIRPTGIATGAALGSPTVALGTLNIRPEGIPSGAAFGQHVLFSGFLIRGTGIATHQAFGSATVDHPARDVWVGSLNPLAYYIGDNLVDAVYMGTTPVWQ